MTPNYLTMQTELSITDLFIVYTIKSNLITNQKQALSVSKQEYRFDIDKYKFIIEGLQEILDESKLQRGVINGYLIKLIICKIEYLSSCITFTSGLDGSELLLLLINSFNQLESIFNSLSTESTQKKE
jgi:hypothetical protein